MAFSPILGHPNAPDVLRKENRLITATPIATAGSSRRLPSLKPASLRNILYAIATFTVLFVTGSRGVSLMQEREEALRRSGLEAQLMTRILEERVLRAVEAAEIAFSAIEKSIERNGAGLQGLLPDRALKANSSVANLTVSDAGGRVVAHASTLPDDPAPRTSFGGTAPSMTVGPSTTPILYVRPIRAPAAGWLRAGLRADFMADSDLAEVSGASTVVSLLDGSGRLVARRGDATALDGTEIVASRQIVGTSLLAEVRIPNRAALEPWRDNIAWTIVGIAILGMGLVILVSYGRRLLASEEEAHQRLQSALDDKEMLLAEVHHRIKNHLQVTVSLLQMQVNRFKDPAVKEALTETKDRLASIGLLHEAIYKDGHGDRVKLGAYLERVVASLASTYGVVRKGIEVTVDVPASLTVDIDRAVPMALIVNEAMTNAMKYAFEGRSGGRLSLAFAEDAEGARLEIRDDGPGLPEGAGESGSLGMRMIRALSTQLGGPVTFSMENGTVVRIPLG